METPCGGKPQAMMRQFHYDVKQIQDVGVWGGFKFPSSPSLFVVDLINQNLSSISLTLPLSQDQELNSLCVHELGKKPYSGKV